MEVKEAKEEDCWDIVLVTLVFAGWSIDCRCSWEETMWFRAMAGYMFGRCVLERTAPHSASWGVVSANSFPTSHPHGCQQGQTSSTSTKLFPSIVRNKVLPDTCKSCYAQEASW